MFMKLLSALCGNACLNINVFTRAWRQWGAYAYQKTKLSFFLNKGSRGRILIQIDMSETKNRNKCPSI